MHLHSVHKYKKQINAQKMKWEEPAMKKKTQRGNSVATSKQNYEAAKREQKRNIKEQHYAAAISSIIFQFKCLTLLPANRK